MRHSSFILAAILFLLVLACIKQVDINVPDRDGDLVVSASLGTVAGTQEVRLTRVAAYTTRALSRAVSAAQVWIEDNGGQRQNFVEDSKSKGLYLPSNRSFVAEVGKVYTLHVLTSDNLKYESSAETVRPANPIKKVYPEPILVEDSKLGQAINGYTILLDTDDPATKGDYYRWTWTHYDKLDYCSQFNGIPYVGGSETLVGFSCCQDCWDIIRCYRNCTNVLSDALVNGKTITRRPITTAPYCNRDYYIEIQQRLISKEAYDYWRAVSQLSTNNGSLFDTAPAAVRGNIKCISDPSQAVYGLFEASSISEDGFFIKRTQATLPGVITCAPTPQNADPIVCAPCVESAFRTRTKPKFWDK